VGTVSGRPATDSDRTAKALSQATAEELPILYRDDCLVAINKPAGLLVHRSDIDRHETRFAIQILRDQIGQHVFPVHRLDKPTAGVLLFALDRETARRTSELFAARKTVKTYHAIVRGFTEPAGHIDYALKEQADGRSGSMANLDKPAQTAVTDYRRLATIELPHAVGRYATARYSLLLIRPQTGRKHQIRRHLKHIFHPIVGDTSHGDGKHNSFFREQFNCHRLLLAATALELNHPHSGEALSISAPLDEGFATLLSGNPWQHYG